MSLRQEFRYNLPPPDHSPETRKMRLRQMDALSVFIGAVTAISSGVLFRFTDVPSSD